MWNVGGSGLLCTYCRGCSSASFPVIIPIDSTVWNFLSVKLVLSLLSAYKSNIQGLKSYHVRE